MVEHDYVNVKSKEILPEYIGMYLGGVSSPSCVMSLDWLVV